MFSFFHGFIKLSSLLQLLLLLLREPLELLELISILFHSSRVCFQLFKVQIINLLNEPDLSLDYFELLLLVELGEGQEHVLGGVFEDFSL